MRFRLWIAIAALLALAACAVPRACDDARDGGIGGTGIAAGDCPPV